MSDGVKNWLEIVANIASILTAVVAVFAYVKYRCTWTKKRERLENHLRDEKLKGTDKGQRTILHLIRELGMTESDILQCAFVSKVVGRRVAVDEETGQAKMLFLVYEG